MSTFWSKNFAEGGTDPKRKFRFMVYGEKLGGMVWYAKSCAKPGFTINAAEHKFLNHTFFYPGNVTWQDVTMTLVDPGDPDIAGTLADIIVASKYVIPANEGAKMKTISKSSAVEALGEITIAQLDSDGNEIESWTLWNAWISEYKWGELEYGADDLNTLDVTLKYDWAIIDSKKSKSVANKAGQRFALSTDDKK